MKPLAAIAVFALCGATPLALGQVQRGGEHQAIAYATAAATDPVARLQARMDRGEVALEFDEARGYLPAVLNVLSVPVSSQGLVFSRTSLQVDHIAPWSPRAIYFKDDVYVGWAQGAPIMEIASVDPKLGAVFYTLAQERSSKPTFERESHTCLQCHDSSSSTGGVPGFIMRSVVADRHGYPVAVDSGATTDATPLGKRWGGWYVTGGLGALEHMGNATTPALRTEMGNVQQYLARTPVVSTGGLAELSKKFDTSSYLSGHSDAVALLVLAHQTDVHNLITATRYEALKASPPFSAPSTTLPPAVRGAADRLLRALLFSNAAAYSGRISGTSAFEKEFSATGPRDQNGRSLREFDLERRLFKYPLSYLVYSDAYDSLPAEVKGYLAKRLRLIVSGDDASAEFAHLSPADRQAIGEIVADTKPAILAE